jgi:hypothetical protein
MLNQQKVEKPKRAFLVSVLILAASIFSAQSHAETKTPQQEMEDLFRAPEPKLDALSTIYIRRAGGEIQQIMSTSCVAAFDEAARRSGLKTSFDDIETSRLEGGLRLSIGTGFSLRQGLKGDYVLQLNSFSNPGHVASYLNSQAYNDALADIQRFIFSFGDFVAGLAFGGTSHLFSSDKAFLSPDDLKGRTMVGYFDAVWYLRLHEELGIGYDAILGHTPNIVADQRAALAKAVDRYGATKTFVVMPLVAASRVVPKAMRSYISLTSTTVHFIEFQASIEDWNKINPEGKKLISKLVADASSTCSRANFQKEIAAVEALKKDGSSLVPVDTASFQGLTSDYLWKNLREAQNQVEAAEKNLRNVEASNKKLDINKKAASHKGNGDTKSSSQEPDMKDIFKDIFNPKPKSPAEKRLSEAKDELSTSKNKEKSAREEMQLYEAIQATR